MQNNGTDADAINKWTKRMIDLNLAYLWIILLNFIILFIVTVTTFVKVICIRKRRDLFIFTALTFYIIVSTIGVMYYTYNIVDQDRFVTNWQTTLL